MNASQGGQFCEMSILKTAINNKSKVSTSSNIRCLAFDFNPPSEAMKKHGELMLFVEIKSLPSRIHIKQLINTAGRAFYKNSANSLENRFKMSLRALNELLSSADNDFDIAVAALNNDSLLLSTVGNPSAVIFNQSGQIKVLQNPTTNQFIEIEESALKPGSGLILANNSARGKLQSAELNKLLHLSKQEATDMLERLVDTDDDNISSSSLLILNMLEKSPDNEPNSVEASAPGSNTAKNKPNTLASIAKALSKAFQSIKNILKGISSDKNRQKLHSFASKLKSFWTNLWTKYINPNPKQAIIVVLITTLIVALLLWVIISNLF